MFDEKISCFDEVAERFFFAFEVETRALCFISEDGKLLSDTDARSCRSRTYALNRCTSFYDVDIARDRVLTQDDDRIMIGNYLKVRKREIEIGIS